MARLNNLLFGTILLILSICIKMALSQDSPGNNILASKNERNIRAIQSYVEDEEAYFEGFMACNTYQEKKRLILEIEKTVDVVENFSEKVDVDSFPEVSSLRAKAHYLSSLASGLLGDKKKTEIKFSESEQHLIGQVDGLSSLQNEEIRIAERKRKLEDIHSELSTHLNELATIEVKIKPEKREFLGTNLNLCMLTKPTGKYPQYAPFVVADANSKLNRALLSAAQRQTIYLPKGKYEIVRPVDKKVVSKFSVTNVKSEKSLTLPPRSLLFKLSIIGLSIIALGTLGYFIF